MTAVNGSVTGRDGSVMMGALGYAIEAIGRLPERWQESSIRDDMIKLLAAMSDYPDFYRLTARSHLERRYLTVRDGQLVIADPTPCVVVGIDGVPR